MMVSHVLVSAAVYLIVTEYLLIRFVSNWMVFGSREYDHTC